MASSVQISVPFADPAAENVLLRAELHAALDHVLDSGQLILGAEVARFEAAMAERIGIEGAVGVASGTDALVLALEGAGIGPGDEVVTVAHTAGATVAAIRLTGARPVLVDVDMRTHCMEPGAFGDAIGKRTRAVVPVHLYGQPAAMNAICATAADRNVVVIEDCAQALGASIDGRAVGTFGAAGCFSFYPTKNLGALGDGGLVVSRNPWLLDRVRTLRTYGWSEPQHATLAGGRCSRLDELQAAFLSAKLDTLDRVAARRHAIAGRYTAALADLPIDLPVERPAERHAYHLYVVGVDDRDALAEHLSRDGIATKVHYPIPVHRQAGLAEGACVNGRLTNTERLAERILSLPLFPTMDDEQQDAVVASIRGYFGV